MTTSYNIDSTENVTIQPQVRRTDQDNFLDSNLILASASHLKNHPKTRNLSCIIFDLK